MTVPLGPRAWAGRLTILLNQVLGPNRFPVEVPDVAREFTRSVAPDDPIVEVQGADLPGFDGALIRIPGRGWGIAYNAAMTSPGRVNFTLGHELGHHLMHRLNHPQGFYCSSDDVAVEFR